MYILDTNAFYYAAGLSFFSHNVNKLQTLIKDYPTFIPSTALFEFIVKYRNDISAIHAGGEFLNKNHVYLADNVINPLFEGYSYDLSRISESELQNLSTDVLKNKIDVESRFTAILFNMCLFSACYFSAMSSDTEPSDICLKVIKTVYRVFSPYTLDIFKSAYTEGYAKDDCENFVRRVFSNLLVSELSQGLPYITKAKNTGNDDTISDVNAWFPEQEYSQDVLTLEKRLQQRNSTFYLHQLAVKYWKKNNDSKLEKYIIKLQKPFNDRIPYTALQDYYSDTLERIMVHGGVFWKNDLLDAFILCNVEDKHVLITFDEGVLKHMEKRKDKHPKYQISLDIINKLKL